MTYRKSTTMALVLATLATPALAETATWAMDGVCDGQDAPENHPIQLIEKTANPSLPSTVYIVKVRVKLWPQDGQNFDRNSYIFAGDNDEPDIMDWGRQLADGSWEIDSIWPAGFAMRWAQSHIDLHVGCYPIGIAWTARYTIFYGSSPPTW